MPKPLLPSKPKTLYFAYGSNLWLNQMARRCPNSRYVGRATLADYRWQINDRGFANIIAAPDYYVEGLVYEVDEVDEASLDLCEGVSQGAYAKVYCSITLYPPPPALFRRPTAWIVEKGGPRTLLKRAKKSGRDIQEQPACVKTGVLVYISPDYITDGPPWEEYIERINLGVDDAVVMGVNPAFFQNFVRPYVPERPGNKATEEIRVLGAGLDDAGASAKTAETHRGGDCKAPPEEEPAGSGDGP
jgi:hypothetical protein